MFAEIMKHGICFLPTLFRHDAQSYLYSQIKYASDTPWTVFHMNYVLYLLETQIWYNLMASNLWRSWKNTPRGPSQ